MSDVAKRLIKLKEDIERAKTEKTKLEAGLKIYMDDLKEKFKVSTVKDALKLINDMKQEQEKIQAKIQKIYEHLEKNYGEL